MEEFNEWVEANGLLEMPFSGNLLSWCNEHHGLSRQWARLDQVFMNINFLNEFSDARMSYLARSSSDLSPIVIKLERDNIRYGFPSFRFQQMWVSHELFFECVMQSWQADLRQEAHHKKYGFSHKSCLRQKCYFFWKIYIFHKNLSWVAHGY